MRSGSKPLFRAWLQSVGTGPPPMPPATRRRTTTSDAWPSVDTADPRSATSHAHLGSPNDACTRNPRAAHRADAAAWATSASATARWSA